MASSLTFYCLIAPSCRPVGGAVCAGGGARSLPAGKLCSVLLATPSAPPRPAPPRPAPTEAAVPPTEPQAHKML